MQISKPNIVAIFKVSYIDNHQFLEFNRWLKKLYPKFEWYNTLQNKMKIDDVYDDFKEFYYDDKHSAYVMLIINSLKEDSNKKTYEIHYYDKHEIITELKVLENITKDWNRYYYRQLKIKKLLNGTIKRK